MPTATRGVELPVSFMTGLVKGIGLNLGEIKATHEKVVPANLRFFSMIETPLPCPELPETYHTMRLGHIKTECAFHIVGRVHMYSMCLLRQRELPANSALNGL